MKRTLIFSLCACLLWLNCALALAAELPYAGYAPTPYGKAAPSPVGYEVESFLTGQNMGMTDLNKPSDLYVEASNGRVYIADTGNARVVVLNRELQFEAEYSAAGEYAFVSPKGVFADGKGHIYVADDGLALTVMMDEKGALLQVFDRPVNDLYEETTPYAPQKVVADSAGRVYVLSQGVYQGLICFQPNGSFMSFYGANHVEVTAKVVLQKLLRMFTTREQWAGMEAFIPIEYSNIDIGMEDIIYASVGTLEQSWGNSVYLLNPLGVPFRRFNCGPAIDTLSSNEGYYTVLSRDFCEILEFYEEGGMGAMLSAAGKGSQKGLFQDPVALGRLEGDLLVLDRQNGSITRFRLTDFGRLVHQGILYSSQGLYQEAIGIYQELLRMDQNYTPAYAWLGKAHYELEEYEESMRCYRLANQKTGYSEAFKEHATDVIRQYIGWIAAGAAVLVVAVKAWGRLRKKGAAARKEGRAYLKPWRHPFHCMLHAYSGFEGVKLYGQGSVAAGAAIVGALFLSSVVSYVLTGFAFNPNRIEDLNVLWLLGGSLGSFSLFYVSALAVSSLMSDCEGKPRELFIVSSYALLPFVLSTLAVAVLTNFLSLDVQAFIVFFRVMMIGWSVILLTVGMMQINQLTLKKTLLYLLLVLLSLVIVLVLLVLLYSLIQQFMVFLQTLASEMMYRM